MPETVLFTVCHSEFYGTQRNVLSTAKHLRGSRYTPVVAAPPGDAFFRALDAAGVESVQMPFRGLGDLATISGIRSLIKTRNVALIHAHLGISTFLSLAASKLAGNVPVIATRHFIEDRYTTIGSRALFNVYRNIYNQMNRRLRRVIFVSGAVRRAIEDREGSLGGRGVVIQNGVDLLQHPIKEELMPEQIDRLRDRFGVPPDRFLIATLSRLSPEKGLDTLIAAAAALKRVDPALFYFVVAGDGPLRKQLESEARALNVQDCFRFAGYVENPRELLAASDAFVLCARAEPFGIAVLEAMAVGVPAIVARSGGPLEIIKDTESGLFFEPGDAAALTRRIVSVASEPELKRSLVRGARARVADFDERAIALRIRNVYDEVLAEK